MNLTWQFLLKRCIGDHISKKGTEKRRIVVDICLMVVLRGSRVKGDIWGNPIARTSKRGQDTACNSNIKQYEDLSRVSRLRFSKRGSAEKMGKKKQKPRGEYDCVRRIKVSPALYPPRSFR